MCRPGYRSYDPRPMRLATPLTVGCLAALLFAAPAQGAATRAEYVAQVDPICKAAGPMMKKSLAGVKPPSEAKIESLDPKKGLKRIARSIGKLFGRTHKVLSQMTTRVSAVAAAPGDEAIVADWIFNRRSAEDLLARAARAGKHGKFFQMFGLMLAYPEAEEAATASVRDFGFRHCLYESG
jgi:hypothetical protein